MRAHPSSTGTRRLVIVSNRLPVTARGPGEPWMASPGGLVRAVLPAVQEAGGAWVGWAGYPGSAPDPFEHSGVELVPVTLSAEDIAGYYDGFANTALWPLFHDALRPSVFEPTWWDAYRAVNERFAEAAAQVAAPDAVVWVHDYHLLLVPAMLRERRPDLHIGFFSHIPFPPRELFSRLPWRDEVLRGVLGAEVVGFQSRADCENFAGSASKRPDTRGELPWLLYQGRHVHVAAHPISIDVAEFTELARRPDVLAEAAEIRTQLGNPRRILLGVDRLDYTKGIDARLQAFASALGDGRLDSCVLVQVAVPTRNDVDEYVAERHRVERLVGEINGRYSELGRLAVHYLHRNLPIEKLVALYLAADVLLVTPLQDGMNLVAKEYVASRVDGRGVLVLSEFAGAAEELDKALLVNPYDLGGMTDTIVRAANMGEAEVRNRMLRLRTVVIGRDVHRWAARFLGLLGAKAVEQVS